MFDPYANDTPGVDDAALNLYGIEVDADNDIFVGVKSLRIYNPNATFESIVVRTLLDEEVTLWCPPTSVIVEKLRIKRLIRADANVQVWGYTDFPGPPVV